MSRISKVETAVRYLLVCAIFASALLPAQAQGATTASGGMITGPQTDNTQAGAPLFTQPNYEGDLRQHSFFAGNYRDPIQTGVGYNDQPLFYWKNPILQQPYNGGPTPISTGLIGDNIDTTVQSSVPGLVNAAVTGAVVGASVIAGAGSTVGADTTAGTSTVGAAGTNATVTGNVADGTQF